MSAPLIRLDSPAALLFGAPGAAMAGLLVMISLFGLLIAYDRLRLRNTPSIGILGSQPAPFEPGDLRGLWVAAGVSWTGLALGLLWLAAAMLIADPGRRPVELTVAISGGPGWWRADYRPMPGERGFTTANELHVPVGKPVRIELAEGIGLPESWTPALAVHPQPDEGRVRVLRLEADHVGRFVGRSSGSPALVVSLVAQRDREFAAWRHSQIPNATPPSAARARGGEALFLARCGECHSVRGTKAKGESGPDLTHLMSRRTLAGGVLPNTPVDLAAFIEDPQAAKPATTMPKPYLARSELGDLLAYLQTLN